jgi:hypothetical protein
MNSGERVMDPKIANGPIVPQITGPLGLLPEYGPELDVGTIQINERTYSCARLWGQVFATDLACGEKNTFTVKSKVGVSEAILAEIGADIKTSVGFWASELSGKISASVTFTREKEETFEVPVEAPRCGGVARVTWQLLERYRTLKQESRIKWWSHRNLPKRFENRLNVFEAGRHYYPVEDCCERGFKQALTEGFKEVFLLRSRGLSIACLGKTGPDGRIRLWGLRGTFVLGQNVSVAPIANALGIPLEPEIATGPALIDEYIGTTEHISLRLAGTRFTPWVSIVAGCAVGLLASFALRKAIDSLRLRSVEGEMRPVKAETTTDVRGRIIEQAAADLRERAEASSHSSESRQFEKGLD